jgi:vesicle transport protein SEC22
MTEMSGNLSMESRKYLQSTKTLNLQLLYRKYGPPAVVVAVIVLVLVVRYYWF